MAATIAALAVIVLAKFLEGAWIVVLALPATVWLLLTIHWYYVRLDKRLTISGPMTLEETEPPTVLVAVEGRNRLGDRALRLAMTLSPDVPLAAIDGRPAFVSHVARDLMKLSVGQFFAGNVGQQ